MFCTLDIYAANMIMNSTTFVPKKRWQLCAATIAGKRGEGMSKPMTVKQVKDALANMPDDTEVFIRCTSGDIGSNITAAETVEETTYGSFGVSIPCVIIEPNHEFIRNRRKVTSCKE